LLVVVSHKLPFLKLLQLQHYLEVLHVVQSGMTCATAAVAAVAPTGFWAQRACAVRDMLTWAVCLFAGNCIEG
jgi:hypothetical protein